MYDPNREKKIKTVALALADFTKFTIIHLHYCSNISLSRLAEMFKISYTKLKNSISKAPEIYDIDYMCSDFPLEHTATLMPFYKEVNGRYKCMYCGRYVAKRGRTLHILTVHKDLISKYVR